MPLLPSSALDATSIHETAYCIAAICLASTGHFIGAVVCAALTVYASHRATELRRLARAESESPLAEPSADSTLPDIELPATKAPPPPSDPYGDR
jgi:hypothetical protein